MTIKPETTKAILDVVRVCPAAQMATMRDDGYPETRHMANMMNRRANNLELWFMTSRSTPKAAQIKADGKCCLYYYDDETHHSVRLFGTLALIDDKKARHEHWMDEFAKFGYRGADDPEFVLLRFTPHEYKYYDADGLQTGKIK